jgi:hypothetical protein
MMSDIDTTLPPRVVIVMAEQWTRAMLRAALREEGYDAIGSRGVREAFRLRPDDPARGPIRLLIVDQDALSSVPASLVPALVARLGAPATIMIRRVTTATPAGEWSRVLRRPVSIEEIVTAARELLPLPLGARHPVDT